MADEKPPGRRRAADPEEAAAREQAAADAAGAAAAADPGLPADPPGVEPLSGQAASDAQAAADAAGRAAAGLPAPEPADADLRKAAVYSELAEEAGHPTAYIARRNLPIGGEMGDMPPGVAAFQAGDQVPAEHVQRFGWAAFVDPPAPPAPAGAEPEE